MVSGGCDRVVRLWDLEAKQESRSFEGHSDYAEAVALFPDGQFIASASRDKVDFGGHFRVRL